MNTSKRGHTHSNVYFQFCHDIRFQVYLRNIKYDGYVLYFRQGDIFFIIRQLILHKHRPIYVCESEVEK